MPEPLGRHFHPRADWVNCLNAELVFQDGLVQLAAGADAVDLARLQLFDSSLLAIILGWQRFLLQNGRSLRILNPSKKFTTLARLYGIDRLISLPVAGA